MQIFVIPPISHMELSELGDNNLFVLAQLWKKYPKYQEYVLKAKAAGRFIILDNGMGDSGDFIEPKELLEIALELKPNEVIPTDTLYDCDKTISNTEWFIWQLQERNLLDKIHIFMCPQGNTRSEWLRCYNYALMTPEVSTIGMSKKTIPYVLYGAQNDQKIGQARNEMFDHLRDMGMIQKPLHFLGSEGPDEYIHYKEEPLVRSTDSCICCLAAINGMRFASENYERIPTPSDYFEKKMNRSAIELTKDNAKYFKECID